MSNFTTSDPGQFALSLKRWVDVDVIGKARTNTLALLRGIYAMILVGSPVLTGRFRANTKFGLDAINTETTTVPDKTPVVGTNPRRTEWATSGYTQMRAGFKLGATVNISNSVRMTEDAESYANRVEYAGWPSRGPYAPFEKALLWASSDVARAIMYGKGRSA